MSNKIRSEWNFGQLIPPIVSHPPLCLIIYSKNYRIYGAYYEFYWKVEVLIQAVCKMLTKCKTQSKAIQSISLAGPGVPRSSHREGINPICYYIFWKPLWNWKRSPWDRRVSHARAVPLGSATERSRGHPYSHPYSSKFSQFHVVFWKIWQNCMLATTAPLPPPEDRLPPTENPGSAPGCANLGLILGSKLRLKTVCPHESIDEAARQALRSLCDLVVW